MKKQLWMREVFIHRVFVSKFSCYDNVVNCTWQLTKYQYYFVTNNSIYFVVG